MMRSRLMLALLCAVVVLMMLWSVVARILTFTHIFYSHSGITLTQLEAAGAHNSSAPDSRKPLIPKIIHQIFHNWKDPGNDKLPEDWAAVRQTCIDKNPGWDVWLWTEGPSREFIEHEYPWFLRTYDGYRFKVQRVDALRYFLLLHYGGIYLDLDNGCTADLTPLTYYPMWITDPGRGALSNNVLGARPHHPFWNLLTQSLMPYDHSYIFPYATISYASGQWFETAVWEKYHSLLPPQGSEAHDGRLHRLMMDDRDGADPWVYFNQGRGATWINWDNLMFLWIGDHLFLFFLGLFGLPAALLWGGLKLWRRRYRGYKRVVSLEMR